MIYQEAVDLLNSARKRGNGNKKLANNTYLVRIDEHEVAIKLHETNILTFYDNGDIKLNSGTWRTPTTKERMNKYLPEMRVIQEHGLWYVGKDWNDKQSLFFDGIMINGTKILNPRVAENTELYKKKIDKMVSKYIKGFVNHVVENGLQKPSEGDCWPCSMKDANDPSRPDPLGIDHYLSHFEEGYYVPSLLMNAILEKKYGNPGLVWSMMEHDPSFRKREVTDLLRTFFRKRKLALVQELSKTSI